MKKILLSAAVMLFAFGEVGAQSTKTAPQNQQPTTVNRSRVQAKKMTHRQFDPEKVAKVKVERMDQMVQLSEAQKKATYAIYLKEAQELQGRMALKRETQKEVGAVLTPEQNEKLKQARIDRVSEMKARQKERRASSTH